MYKDYKIVPRTVFIKSYRRRESSGIGKAFRFFVYFLVLAAIVSVAVLIARLKN